MSTKKKNNFRAPKLSVTRRADPFLKRELENYEHPLPSREYILQVLGEQEGVPVSFERLCELLDIRDFEQETFRRRLGAMARDAQLLQNRRNDWLIPKKADLIHGRVQGHPDGFGFLIPEEEGGEDIFLSPKEMERVLHGDKAIVRVIGMDRRGRPEGKIIEVTERANSRIVGRVLNEHGIAFVVAENKRISQDILIAPPAKGDRKALRPQAGQVVMVEIIEQPDRHSQPIGRVVEILGNYADPGMEIEIALRKHELPFEFSNEVQAQTRKLPDQVRKSDWKGREDITHLPLVTIDGETARDFDDAVFCEREGKNGRGGYRLIVAIADVSHYVTDGSPLDLEAYERGNSVYFPRRVIPMLPEKLSNGLCSLNPQVERLCMVCDMSIAANGEIKRYRFYPAVMYSHARLTYTQVAAALYEKDPATREHLAALLPQLENLDALYRKLATVRSQRGAIDFETSETRMVFDDQGKIDRIEPYARNEAHRIIEECMLAANVCASEFLAEHEHPALYRVHEGPTPERLGKLRDFIQTFGLQLGGGDSPTAKDYAQLLDRIGDRPDRQLLQTVMLRSLRQAVYSPDNVGHFGLAYECYTHFTSPIRRYPDLLVHRAIKAVLARQPYQAQVGSGDWSDIGLHCSATERRADEATRDVENWLKCFYMKDRIGEEFTGSIASVVPFGIFVALDDVYVEGLVHVSELGQDYFKFDEKAHAMLGERTGKRYRLSDRVRVQLMRVDMEQNKIDFRLVAGSTERRIAPPPALPDVADAPLLVEVPSPVKKKSKLKALAQSALDAVVDAVKSRGGKKSKKVAEDAKGQAADKGADKSISSSSDAPAASSAKSRRGLKAETPSSSFLTAKPANFTKPAKSAKPAKAPKAGEKTEKAPTATPKPVDSAVAVPAKPARPQGTLSVATKAPTKAKVARAAKGPKAVSAGGAVEAVKAAPSAGAKPKALSVSTAGRRARLPAGAQDFASPAIGSGANDKVSRSLAGTATKAAASDAKSPRVKSKAVAAKSSAANVANSPKAPRKAAGKSAAKGAAPSAKPVGAAQTVKTPKASKGTSASKETNAIQVSKATKAAKATKATNVNSPANGGPKLRKAARKASSGDA